jgi:hypothetical protein
MIYGWVVVLSESRFQPRSFLADPKSFGHPRPTSWKPKNLAAEPGWDDLDREMQLRAVSRMRAEFPAAQAQDRACETIRRELKSWTPTPEQTSDLRAVFAARKKSGVASKTQRYAVLTGNSYDRLIKMLRGEVVMRLEDMAIADALLGTNLTGLRRAGSSR